MLWQEWRIGMAINIDELYYQDMINNNYTSNMLGSVMGTTSSNNVNSITSILSTLSGIGGLDTSGLLQGTSGISFSNILSQYMKTASIETQEASKWTEALGDVLEEVEKTGNHSKSTATVQELYDYFQEKMASGANGISSLVHTGNRDEGTSSADSASRGMAIPDVEGGILNETAIEAEIESAIEASITLSL